MRPFIEKKSVLWGHSWQHPGLFETLKFVYQSETLYEINLVL